MGSQRWAGSSLFGDSLAAQPAPVEGGMYAWWCRWRPFFCQAAKASLPWVLDGGRDSIQSALRAGLLLSFSLSLTFSLSHSLAFSHTRTHTHTHSLSPPLSLPWGLGEG